MPDPSVSPVCPTCRSALLHPQRLRSTAVPPVTVDLRCAECGTWTHGSYFPAQLARLSAEQRAGRHALVEAYERCVAESMEALADCLSIALWHDLVGADDFAPRAVGSATPARG